MTESFTARAPLAVVLALVLALALGACGSSASSSSSASGSAAAQRLAPPTPAQLRARIKLARCMREQGVDVPDAAATGTPASAGAALQLLQKYSLSRLMSAANACRPILLKAFPQIAVTPAQLAQQRRQAFVFARCMRARGIQIPDPTTSAPGFGMLDAFRSQDFNSPVFKNAMKACQTVQ